MDDNLMMAPNPYGVSARVLRRDRDFVRFTIDRLAHCVTCGSSINLAIKGLLRERELTKTTIAAARWRERLTQMLGDVEAGIPLADTLERHMGKLLPSHFIPALRQAEGHERVDTVLPVLAKHLHRTREVIQLCRTALAYPIMQFLVLYTIASGLVVFIIPKFARMFEEMMPGQEPFFHRHVLPVLHHWLTADAALCLLLACLACLFVIYFDPKHARSTLWQPIAHCLRHLPFSGRVMDALAWLQVHECMAAFLNSGVGLAEAAELSADTIRTPRLARRLEQFVADVRNGTDWVTAWPTMHSQRPLYTWIVRNSAAREAPEEGFALAAEWLTEDILARSRRLACWVEPTCILFNAVVVGLIAFATLLPMIELIRYAF